MAYDIAFVVFSSFLLGICAGPIHGWRNDVYLDAFASRAGENVNIFNT